MWHRPFPSGSTMTKLFLGEGQSSSDRLKRGPRAKYDEKKGNYRDFINAYGWLLPSFCRQRGLLPRSIFDLREHCGDRIPGQTAQEPLDWGIIPGQDP